MSVDPEHFTVDIDGAITPQPWMAYRHVASATAVSRGGSYNVTGGLGKNDLLHSLQQDWANDTPVDQYCYALVTRGGARVTLQARSRGYLQLSTGAVKAAIPPTLTVTERLGCGADRGRAGVLAIGTSFTIMEVRAPTHTIPVAPEFVGWARLTPGEVFTAGAELRFVTEFWETSTVDGGDSECETSYVTGDTRLDLFALPVIE